MCNVSDEVSRCRKFRAFSEREFLRTWNDERGNVGVCVGGRKRREGIVNGIEREGERGWSSEEGAIYGGEDREF